jgi:hypothetical protein
MPVMKRWEYRLYQISEKLFRGILFVVLGCFELIGI